MQVRMKFVELVEMQRKKSARQIKSNSKSTNVTKRGGRHGLICTYGGTLTFSNEVS
jgi:hypothetical protein